MENTTSEDNKFEIVEKVPNEKIQSLLKLYSESTSMEAYVKIPFLLCGVMVLIHNVFIAGKSYDYSTCESIKTIELSIVGVLVGIVIVIAIIAMIKNAEIKKGLLEITKRYNIKKEIVQEEFNALGVHLYGGRGVVLK